ncbi:MAG: TIGR04325 family methyltransferase [Gemmatimonadaceae bacterium]
MSNRVVQMVERALSLPGVSGWRQRHFDDGFRAGRFVGVCRGVYDTYEQAVNAAPESGPLGYDHEGPAAMYRDRIDRVFPSDYPMMLWLAKAFASGSARVLDLGGHVGISYYAFQPYVDYPAKLTWEVLDVPTVAKAGRELARSRDSRQSLGFVDSFDAAANVDVLFTAGCVQYLEQTLAEKLQTLAKRPEWVLVNLLPLHEERGFWTVQSIGEAFCPYRIERRAAFFEAIWAVGYDIVDSWENPEKSCIIMFDTAHTVRGYVGAAFRLRH